MEVLLCASCCASHLAIDPQKNLLEYLCFIGSLQNLALFTKEPQENFCLIEIGQNV